MNIKDEKSLEEHFKIDKYGDYQLTEAIRPGPGEKVHQGYRHMAFMENQFKLSVSLACISKECILDVFYEMLDLMSDEVIVVLASNHGFLWGDVKREECFSHIDAVVFKSILVDYEDLMLNDGFFGISVFTNTEDAMEIQLDDHKTLIGYGNKETIKKFDQIYEIYGLVRNDGMKVMAEFQHAHFSSEELYEKYKELKIKLGME